MMQDEVLPKLEEQPRLIPVFLPKLMPLGDRQRRMTIDVDRFEASIRAIVRALFYLNSGHKTKLLNDELFIVWTALKVVAENVRY